MGDSLKFGTSGLRGLAIDLDGVGASRYTEAFLRSLKFSADRCLIGSDLRDSSPSIVKRVAAGVRAAGLVPVDCGALPTPALALAALRSGLPAIMVTGSHIPSDRNGLKFYADGEITKKDEERILAAVKSAGFASLNSAPATSSQPLQDYLSRCNSLLPRSGLRGLKIGVWQHSSVFRDDLVSLLVGFGAEVIPLGRSSAFVAIDTEALESEHELLVAEWVDKYDLDALVSTDGDADRPLVVDEGGSLVRGDVLGVLAGRFLDARIAVTPVTSNSAIEGSNVFQEVLRTKVGSPYVIEAMESRSSDGELIIGFEANGGVLLGNAIDIGGQTVQALPTRDAALPILAALHLVQRLGEPLSRVAASILPPRFARSGRLQDVPQSKTAEFMRQLGPSFFAEVGDVARETDIDGRRFTLAGGDVVHYRPSGNAPELRCYVESDSAMRADEMLAWGLRAAERVV